ncbi:GDSL-type esterase/lipase family protein [Enterobacter asburiae]|uniref:GDSL-type esterase/lipase family protein n=1 Tax=Enterobacter asburiae TaxID=61645 RepID=UPI000BA0600A|nr:GDSL-type esterase/lipase family protein [Enterobacter asburiae]MCE1340626.1 GDSL-type esterase/lipase family protein [Enterobacter asburiae]OZP70110.1 hypothetical protein CIG53_02315 [Enterobacter asburiae]QBB06040.1 SGNH/GDSL hydrolase family protein [Enterobacter cloacae]
MTTQPTQNAVPSESPRDLKFNAGKIDEFVTSLAQQYIDRFGHAHYTIEGLRWVAQQAIAAFGYITLKSFQLGAPLPNNELTLPNHVLQDETDGEYYRWDGAFPKAVPSGSTPESTGGIGIGKWLSVGSAVLSSYQDGAGDALVAVKQPFTGAVQRTQHDKNMDGINVKDFGVINDGTPFAPGAPGTNNKTAIDNTTAAQNTNAGKYAMTSPFVNKWGQENEEILVSDTHKVLNPKHARTNLVVGQEYLSPWYKNFRFDAELGNHGSWGTPPFVIHYCGDSTVVGVGASTSQHQPPTLLKNSSVARGFRDVSVVSSAISGDDAYSWYHSGRMAEAVSTNPNVLLIRYGVNDGARPGWASEFLDTMRSAMSDLRQMKTAAQLPVIIMSPCSTSDPVNYRTEAYHELINQGLRQVARDYQCCFIDTYGYYQDSHSGSFYMDTSAGDGHVHPWDELYALINKITADVLFPVSDPLMNVNLVRNMGTSVRALDPSTAIPAAAFQGISFDRVQGGSNIGNTPYDGFLYSFKTTELGLVQISTPITGVTSGRGIAVRVSKDSVGGVWLGKRINAVPFLTSPVTSSDAEIQTSLEGRVFINGTFNVPAATSVTMFNIPPGYRPAKRVIGVVGSTAGVNTNYPFSVELNGNVIVYGPSSSTVSVSFSGQSYAFGD